MNALQDLILIGAGGNSRVIVDMIVREGRFRLVGIVDDDPSLAGKTMMGATILGPRSRLADARRSGIRHAVIGIVGSNSTSIRRRICEDTRSAGFDIPSIVHPSAIVAGSADVGDGVLIMAGAIINPCAVIANDALVNTGAIVEHDCAIEEGAFLGPGVRLGGNTRISRHAFLGVAAVTIPGIRVGEEALVAAGAVLTRDVPARHFARGVPAASRPLATHGATAIGRADESCHGPPI